ncbi:hypothetical protein GCM10009768_03240 [Leucobacter iarius]|uniref:Bacterial Ig domain-containing protein n=1 Tax=Leucobacter iarius TaxID=333963 RepID=A0ABP4XE16_9MICO
MKDADGAVLGTTTVGADGKWSLTPEKDLANGKHAITAEQDANGAKSTASGSFEVKASASVAVTGPSGTVAGYRPTITGTGEPGASVTVKTDTGTNLGTVTVGADGKWSLVPVTNLSVGNRTVTATQNANGVETTATGSFEVKTPEAPVIGGPTGTIGNVRPTITGTGEPGAKIRVRLDNGAWYSSWITVGADGKWSVPVPKDLAEGAHGIDAEQQVNGHSRMANPKKFRIAVKVAVTGPSGTVTEARPKITGTGEPGSTITVKDEKGVVLGTATVGDGGDWSLTPSKDLANGTYQVTAEQTVGGVKTTSTGGFEVKVAEKAKVAVTGPTGTTNDPRPAITGTGQPGATVTVKDGNGEVLGTATVGSDGKWSVKPGTDLPEGAVSITAEQNAGGQTSSATGSFDVNIIDDLTVTGPTAGSTVDSKKPVVSGTAEPGAEITVKDKDGNVIGETVAGEDGKWTTPIGTLPTGPVEIVVTDNHGGSQNVDFIVPADKLIVTGPETGSTVDSKTPTVEGTGEPGAEITITDEDGNVIGETVVDENGNWSVTLPELGGGSTGITVTDNHGGSQDIDFEVPFENLVVTGPTPGSTVDSKKPVVSGTAEPGAEITVTDKNGNVIGETVAGEDGKWTTPIGTLPTGPAEIVVTDNHGGSQNVDFIVPAEELIVTAPAPEGDAKPTVDSKTPTVSGTGEPGAEITVTDEDGNVIGETVVDENGDWAVTLPELENGDHTITVADNLGGSKEVEFIVSAENGDEPMTAGSLAGVMLAGAAGLGLLIRRRQQAKVDA